MNRKEKITLFFIDLLNNFFIVEHSVPLPPSMFKNSQPPAQLEVANWLPQPPPGMLQNAMKKVSPPKPDTPPSPVSTSTSRVVEN